MFTLHMQGLCIAIATDEHVLVAMLNSGARQALAPFHLQSLYMRHEHVTKTSLVPLPTVKGRWRKVAEDREFLGWSLTGLAVDVGSGGPPKLPESRHAGRIFPPSKKGKAKASRTPAKVADLDWNDLQWVLNTRKLFPSGAMLLKKFRTIGVDTLATVTCRGGELTGGLPTNSDGAEYIWYVNPTYVQAFTDTVDIRFTELPQFVARNYKGDDMGTIQVKDGGEAWLINETTERDQMLRRTGLEDPQCEDMKLFLEAFDVKNAIDKELIRPHAEFNFVTRNLTFTAHCELLLHDERSKW